MNFYSDLRTRKPTVNEVVASGETSQKIEATARATFVSMGNPHAVMFVEDAKGIDRERLRA